MKFLLKTYVSVFVFIAFFFFTKHILQASSKDQLSFKVMSYNVQNFLFMDRDSDGQEDDPKPASEKEPLFTIIVEESPDILGLMEIGNRPFLYEIQRALSKKGLEYPYDEWIEGEDHVRHIGILSRFPIVSRQPHIHAQKGVGTAPVRGFIEVDIQIKPYYQLKTYVVHFKSKRNDNESSIESDRKRLKEAKLLRYYINEDLAANSRVNLIVMGDFNDSPESESIRYILSNARCPLFDLLPLTRRGFEGTFFYRLKKTFERIDYFFVSSGLKYEYIPGTALIRDDRLAWKASDHFSIQAQFHAKELDPL